MGLIVKRHDKQPEDIMVY